MVFNVVIMASVNLAAAKIANVLLGWPIGQTLLVCGVINVAFAATSGLWGVLVTDFIQFGIAMGGLVCRRGLRAAASGGRRARRACSRRSTRRRWPSCRTSRDWTVALPIFIVPLTVQWWSTWYPGSEPGGGSYVAQRMLAARTERDALAGTLLFNVAHYALRPWPWIIVALASMLVFPEVADIRRALPHVDPALVGHDMAYPAMLTFLPPGMLGRDGGGAAGGLRLDDLDAPQLGHVVPRARPLSPLPASPTPAERHYVMAGRLVTALLMVAAGLLTLVLESARGTFNLLLSIGAGTGLLYLLRWFWWRINAWSEIAAMASSFVLAVGLLVLERNGVAIPAHLSLIVTVAVTTVVWLAATYLTPPTDDATLRRFYTLARPAGPGWAAVRRACGNLAPSEDLRAAFLRLGGQLRVRLQRALRRGPAAHGPHVAGRDRGGAARRQRGGHVAVGVAPVEPNDGGGAGARPRPAHAAARRGRRAHGGAAGRRRRPAPK